MPPITAKDITRHQVLEYMAALYAENPQRAHLQEFLSDTDNYAKFIANSVSNRGLYSKHLKENPSYYLSEDVFALFSTLRVMPPAQFHSLLTKHSLLELEQNLLVSADTLHRNESAFSDSYSAIRKDGALYAKNTDTREVDDFDQWSKAPSSIMSSYSYTMSSMDTDRLQDTIASDYVVVTGPKNQFAFFDRKKHDDGKATVAVFEENFDIWQPNAYPSSRSTALWKEENGRMYLNAGVEGDKEEWREFTLDADQKHGYLHFPEKSPWKMTLNTPLVPGKPVDMTVLKEQSVAFLPYQNPEQFTDVMDHKQKLDGTLTTIDSELKQFAVKNKVAILGDRERQENDRQKRYNEIIDTFGIKFKNTPTPEWLDKMYTPLFKDIPEQRPLFDMLQKTYQLLHEQVLPITNPADQERVLQQVIQRYFEPSSHDYLFNNVTPDTRQKLDKVFDILQHYKENPALKDRRFDDVLHQLDYELKDRLIPQENREYRAPLNGSRCPSCDEEFKQIIDTILKENGLIVSAPKLPVLDMKTDVHSVAANIPQTKSGESKIARS